MKIRKHLWEYLIVCVLAALILFVPADVSADALTKAEEKTLQIDESDTEEMTIVFAERDYKEETTIPVPFYTVDAQIHEWAFPYSDEYFTYASDTFDNQLAQASMGLAVSAFRNDAYNTISQSAGNDLYLDNQYATYLSAAGFSEIRSFGYEEETSQYSLSGVIASRQIGDFTLIAAAPCGQGYQKEWISNLCVGTGERHEGFDYAAQLLEEQIYTYLEEQHITGEIRLWITGFSRASAVANLAAADLIRSGDFSDVYAYLFAVPRTTKNPEALQGIYNICGKFDPVTSFPLQSWGFERYGTNVYTPAQEMDSLYADLATNASAVSVELTGDNFRNNPEVNYQFHLIIEFLAEMFPTAQDYAEQLQPVLMEKWTEPGLDKIVIILNEAMNALNDLNARAERSKDIFLDYIGYVASIYLRGNQQQIADGSWNPDLDISMNVGREHLPSTYISWLFSDNPAEQLYDGGYVGRRLTFNGGLDLAIYQKDRFVGSIDADGNVVPSEDTASGTVRLTAMRKGNHTILFVPEDVEYDVILTANTNDIIYYYDVELSAGEISAQSGQIHIALLSEGTYRVSVGSEEISEPAAIDGNVQESVLTEYTYTPEFVMAEESSTEWHLTLDFLLNLLFLLGILIGGLLLFCLVTALRHLQQRNRGNTVQYSSLWIIVPHVLLIGIFGALTEFFTLNFYSIGQIKNVVAGLTLFSACLLAFRGWLRNRRAGNLTYMLVLLALSILNFLFFDRSVFALYTVPRAVLFTAFVLLLTAGAVGTFYSGIDKTGKQKHLLPHILCCGKPKI